jgi:hypothetical protein
VHGSVECHKSPKRYFFDMSSAPPTTPALDPAKDIVFGPARKASTGNARTSLEGGGDIKFCIGSVAKPHRGPRPLARHLRALCALPATRPHEPPHDGPGALTGRSELTYLELGTRQVSSVTVPSCVKDIKGLRNH